jgi:hypothetical protein
VTSPYRVSSAALACPHCRSVLERTASGVHECERCGSWIEEAALAVVFGAPWPAGTPMPWPRGIPCVLCARPMRELLVEDFLVDRCAEHGVWVERGVVAMQRRLDVFKKP